MKLLRSNPPGPRPGTELKSNFYGRCDVAAGFSPPFAETANAANLVHWKAEAFHYIDCANCLKQPLTLVNLEVT